MTDDCKGYFEDERGSKSMGRTLTFIWTMFCVWMVALHWATLSAAVLAFLSTIEMAFIAWTAGPRIASYLAPQIANAAKAIASVAERRDVKEGLEPTKD